VPATRNCWRGYAKSFTNSCRAAFKITNSRRTWLRRSLSRSPTATCCFFTLHSSRREVATTQKQARRRQAAITYAPEGRCDVGGGTHASGDRGHSSQFSPERLISGEYVAYLRSASTSSPSFSLPSGPLTLPQAAFVPGWSMAAAVLRCLHIS
jgi:hypothetical protein